MKKYLLTVVGIFSFIAISNAEAFVWGIDASSLTSLNLDNLTAVRLVAFSTSSPTTPICLEIFDSTATGGSSEPCYLAGFNMSTTGEQGPYQSIISNYCSANYSFCIQVGSYSDATFTCLAQSESLSYNNASQYITSSESGAGSLPAQPWQGGTFTAVPEPTSALLMLFGGLLLSLRRRKL